MTSEELTAEYDRLFADLHAAPGDLRRLLIELRSARAVVDAAKPASAPFLETGGRYSYPFPDLNNALATHAATLAEIAKNHPSV